MILYFKKKKGISPSLIYVGLPAIYSDVTYASMTALKEKKGISFFKPYI